jgi:hypothetical protein
MYKGNLSLNYANLFYMYTEFRRKSSFRFFYKSRYKVKASVIYKIIRIDIMQAGNFILVFLFLMSVAVIQGKTI